ncbi:MAG: TlpA family protein disulfide reductase [Proteobacteria bacterium]|nr:TlpA family protein disulfide reductase [Pseudomonadota bacterium]
MTFFCRFLAALFFVIMLLPAVAAAREFPDFLLEGDIDQTQLDSLGVAQLPLHLSDIKAEYLLVEVFSMYCPICQGEAEHVNLLHELILGDGLNDRLKIVGIGTGNTPFEVQLFRDQYDIKFPLFHDEQFEVNTALGQVGTPHFVLLRNSGPDALEELLVEEGVMDNLDAFYARILKAAGLK